MPGRGRQVRERTGGRRLFIQKDICLEIRMAVGICGIRSRDDASDRFDHTGDYRARKQKPGFICSQDYAGGVHAASVSIMESTIFWPYRILGGA